MHLFQSLHYENEIAILYKTLKQPSEEEIQLFSVKYAVRYLRPVLLPLHVFDVFVLALFNV